MPTTDEILNALRTLRDVCLEQRDCDNTCPLFRETGCGLHNSQPDRWRLNEKVLCWKAFLEECK